MAGHSYASGISDAPLVDHTVGQLLAQRAAESPQDLGLVSMHQEVRLSWAELLERSRAVARGLFALGVERGDRVGIWSPTRVEWTELQFGSAMVGAVLVNINPAYRSAELAYALDKVGVRVLVSAPGFRGADYRAMVDEVRASCPSLEVVVMLEAPRAAGPSDLLWSEFLAAGERIDAAALEARNATLDADDPINIQFTSGTTGRPKGATLTHHNVVNNAGIFARMLGYGPLDRVCIPVPLYHCFGMGLGNLGCVFNGATMVYPAEAFDPEATLRAIAQERCTSIYGVPTMFIAMLGHPDFASYDLDCLRTGVMAGAPCPIELMRRVVEEMHASEMTIAYGMTETAPASTMTRRHDSLEVRTSSVGSALPHTEIKIVDPLTDLVVARGEPGELCSRGYLVMAGYWGDDDATNGAIRSGWMHTGDLAVMDDFGRINIVGRLKEMVIRGGENLYPREIEEVLFTHPGVASAQVVGVPDERFGEELAAFVVLADGATLSDEEVRTFCGEHLARFKVPRYVLFVQEFPMTVTGKVQKFHLREQAIESLGLEAAAAIETA